MESGGEEASGPTGDDEAGSGAAAAAVEGGIGDPGLVIVAVMEGPMSLPLLCP